MNQNKQKYLFLFTIGPVQSFIAQARKAQDLYAGSQILSRLIKVGLKQLPHWKENIIFPVLNKDDNNQSLPNRFIGIVDGNQDLKMLGEKVQEVVKNEFKKISAEALKKAAFNKSEKDVTLEELFYDQIETHLDIHWAFHPLTENDYKTSYKEIESILGSVKNIRPFNQYGNGSGEAGRKCSLDGENNALFFGRKKPSLSIKEQRNNSVTLRGFLTDEKEGLSAVSFVKRYGVKADSFPSTAEIAVLYDESQLTPDKVEIFNCLKKLYGNEKDVFQVCSTMMNNRWINNCNIKGLNDEDKWNNHFDYQPLFEENLNDKTLPNKEQLRLAKVLQDKLASSFQTKYYALIMFDGDKMGKRLSKANSPEEHKEFSKCLTAFAKEAREKVENHGQTVYTGGDDFLGFVNLNYLFEIMTDLRTAFDETINFNSKTALTFSAGIVIAHYKMPLAEVLKTVRNVEKKAKNDGDRNAFCITAIKHSGEIQEAVYKWGNENTQSNELWKAIEYITQVLSNNTFSNKFITSLTRELYQLSGFELQDIGLIEKAIFTEMERLVKRALIDTSGSKEEKESRVNDLCERLELLYKNRVPNQSLKPIFKGIQNFVHALQMADFLSRKIS